MEVRISGGEFSSLLFAFANGREDVEGFLLGEVKRTTVNTVSDSYPDSSEELQIATIQGFVPCEKTFSFYDGVGRISDEKLSEILQDKRERVIGWYKFRRNSQLLASMRERSVHHNLVKHLQIHTASDFIFALTTASMSVGFSAHGFNYCMLRSSRRASSFKSLPVKVINLGDTSHTEYRVGSEISSATSRVYHDVINRFRDELVDNDGVIQQSREVDSMYVLMMKKMKEVATEVQQSEAFVAALSGEVAAKRFELQQAREELARNADLTTCGIGEDTSGRNGHEISLLDAEVPDQKTPVLRSIQLKMEPQDSLTLAEGADHNQSEARSGCQEKRKSEGSLTNVKPTNSQRRKQARPGRVMSLSNDVDEDSDEMADYPIKANS